MGNDKKLQEIISEAFDGIRSNAASIKDNEFSKHYIEATNCMNQMNYLKAAEEFSKAIGIHNDETVTSKLILSLRAILGEQDGAEEKGATICRIIRLHESRVSYWPTQDNYVHYINFLAYLQKSNKGINLIDKITAICEEGLQKHPNSKSMYATMYHVYTGQQDSLKAYISMCKACELSLHDFSFIAGNFGKDIFSPMPGNSAAIKPIDIIWNNYESSIKNDGLFIKGLVEFEQEHNLGGSKHRIDLLWRLNELNYKQEDLLAVLIPKEIELSPDCTKKLGLLQEAAMNAVTKQGSNTENKQRDTIPIIETKKRKLRPKYELAKINPIARINENLWAEKLNPRIIMAELDKYVIGQDHAKRIIANALYNHYKRMKTTNPKWKKKNILLIGPTGCGKTFLASRMPLILNVPYVEGDCSTMTEEGYIGGKVFDMLKDLYYYAKNNNDKPDYGIIYLDEVDKIAVADGEFGRDVRGRGVQQPLLKMIEGNSYRVNIGTHINEEIVDINTNNILFVAGGSFAGDTGKKGLYEIINERLTSKGTVGFIQPAKQGEIKVYTPSNKDLREFGLIPEFIGRFPVRSFLNELSEEQLAEILVKPEEALFKQEQALFKSDGIDLKIEDDAIKIIAAEAKKSKTGARGLNDILSNITADAEYELPGSGETEFVITKKLVEEKINSR